MLQVPDVLSAAELAHCRARLAGATWNDGAITAGHQSVKVKRNAQLAESDPLAQELRAVVLGALGRSPTFLAGALPRRIFPPLFNRYGVGAAFGAHVDNAIRYPRTADNGEPVRTDLSVTLFLSEPAEYDGGELVIEDSFGSHSAKLPAGELLLYPSSSVHHVTEVTRGERVAAFFWVQSLIRAESQRRLLFDLDTSIQQLGAQLPESAEIVRLAGVYHNLLREWSDV